MHNGVKTMNPGCEGCTKTSYCCKNYDFCKFMYNHCTCKECIIKGICSESCRERINLVLAVDRLLKPVGMKT